MNDEEREALAVGWPDFWQVYAVVERIAAARDAAHEAQIRDLLEEREELLTEIRRLRMGNHPAGRALRLGDDGAWGALREALTERDAEHEGGGGA